MVSDFDGAKELVRITPIGAKTNPQWTIRDIDNFDEWFEEIQEPTDSIHWKPKDGDEYCYKVAENQCDWSDEMLEPIIEINGKNYNKADVEEAVKDLEPIE